MGFPAFLVACGRATATLMGRRKAGEVRQAAQEKGRLELSQAFPDDEALARVLTRPSQRAWTTPNSPRSRPT